MRVKTAFIAMIFIGVFFAVYGLFDVTGWINFAIGVIVACVGVMGVGFMEFNE